eukprot:CAMPEP_0204029412 /NCGR_PEP_ID=MMETSP0360-20130528/56179_1 /ASSEMBLY_ACC=CAM_ASM_000342 /TAXON_ID=268821 /ORGANISM="Scrippsiella Hangoei, Strain SHTV-5" /LENGTH=33 /DNA_ID= /DNA_START= /DNA_END= /DNA_ORIENTATION=
MDLVMSLLWFILRHQHHDEDAASVQNLLHHKSA